MELYEMTAAELSRLLDSRKISSHELTSCVLERIKAVDRKLNSFITVDEQNALLQAKAVDEKRAKGESLSDIAGIPVGLKDNISTSGLRTTCASKMLEKYIPPFDATAVSKLRSADSVIVGKLNMDEFAMGSSCENSFFGAVSNPYDTSRVPGGSSGGCAAAVSSGEVIAALGSDTGGSIRQPASFCGAVGLKPTYGSVSRYGLVAFASSLDQIGPICKTAEDAALYCTQIFGHDPNDSTSVNRPYHDFYRSLSSDISGLKIAIPTALYENCCSDDVLASFNAAVGVFRSIGADVRPAVIENSHLALAAYYVISSAEASSNLSRFDGVRYGCRSQDHSDLNDMYVRTRTQGFGSECKRRIMLGTFALSSGYYDEYYKKAVSAAALLTDSVSRLLLQFDVIALPTSPETAFRIGEKSGDPMKMYQSDIFTVLASLTGLPAISFPCGLDRNGLPIGFQLIAGRHCEQTLLNAAFAFEKAAGRINRPKI